MKWIRFSRDVRFNPDPSAGVVEEYVSRIPYQVNNEKAKQLAKVFPASMAIFDSKPGEEERPADFPEPVIEEIPESEPEELPEIVEEWEAEDVEEFDEVLAEE